MARKSKKAEEAANHERWLLTYADLITLLLIFFVIMYAMSKIDTEKYAVLAQALRFEFNSANSVLERGSGFKGDVSFGQGNDGKTTQKDQDGDKKSGQNDQDKQGSTADQEQKELELQNLLKTVNQYIADNNLQAYVFASDTEKGIAITLNDLFLFDLGKANLKQPAYPILDKLASLFPELHAKVSIEGHTDNLPMLPGATFKDNWELSGARALSVLRYFVDTSNLDDKQFVYQGYSDTDPVAPNDSQANRQQNRRVEIVVLREGF